LQAVEAELASRKRNRAACPCGVVTMHRRRPCEEGLECPDLRKVAGGGGRRSARVTPDVI
jgi:hypothetical protein